MFSFADDQGVAELLEQNSQSLVDTVKTIVSNFIVQNITSKQELEDAFIVILREVNPLIDNLVLNLPDNVDPLKDLVAPIIQFHIVSE